MKAKISILGFLDKKLYLSKESVCFAFVIVIEICSVKFNVIEKFTQRSKTSKTLTLVKGSPASSKTRSSGFISLFLLLINSHFDFSFEIFSCQVFAQFDIFSNADLKFDPSLSFLSVQYAFRSSD